MAKTTITDTATVAAVWAAMGETGDCPGSLVVTIPAAGRVAPECACGCGERTGGGVWRPGHDAKHHSALLGLAREGNGEAIDELGRRGWALPVVRVAKTAKAEVAS